MTGRRWKPSSTPTKPRSGFDRAGAMLLRAATTDDARRCAAIYAPYVTESWISFEEVPPTADEMAARIAANGASHGWLVAELDGQIAGYAYGSPHRTRSAYKTSCDVAVYIDPAFARRGVGRALYGALLPQLKDKAYHAAFGGIALPNAASIALHEACGFTPVGVYHEVGWKLGGWRDVGWWQRLL
jgi:L-amino acid N-acyltransferase YncA